MTNVVTFAYFSQAMAADKRVDLLSFTGSTPVSTDQITTVYTVVL